MFNLYGDLKTGFSLQAPTPTWSYVEFNNGYTADKNRKDAGLSVFYLQPIDSFTTYIIETANGVDYFLCASGDQLVRIAKSATLPPATAVFQKLKVTDGYADMKKQHSTLANPLTGAYLAGLDLQNIAFMVKVPFAI